MSALYGASALGGVINLISKRPGDELEAEFLANATTRGGQDLTAYAAGPVSGNAGVSLTAGAHRQSGQDLDGDGWYDMPAYDRLTARPCFQWDGADGSSVYLTLGAMTEEWTGGTLPGRTAPDGSPFAQLQDTDRYDAGLVAEKPVDGLGTLNLRASAMRQDHLHRRGAVVEDDRHTNLFAEASLAGVSGATSWVGGIAFQSDGFRSDAFPAFDYTYDVPGVFAQIEHETTPDLTLAASSRIDFHDTDRFRRANQQPGRAAMSAASVTTLITRTAAASCPDFGHSSTARKASKRTPASPTHTSDRIA